MFTTLLSSILSVFLAPAQLDQAYFYGFLGAASALVFCVIGSAYGTAKAGTGVASVGALRPELIMKSCIPVIMAGMIGIYGLIIAVFISTNIRYNEYTIFQGWTHLGSGLAVGLSGLAAGMCIGVIGDAGVRASAQEDKLFVTLVLMLVFSEALGLYGLIIALIMAVKKS
eukprot:TRINITY_DN2138_c0_g1_i1.p1 TRINITY_DN2138_c0_g1~~TRINITY_DN2138_c0_g1_i1.p1  ORF type:complete len:170 (-),score=24.33 TRINITY_DN2138_c0_g1_i1:82-591(-)